MESCENNGKKKIIGPDKVPVEVCTILRVICIDWLKDIFIKC